MNQQAEIVALIKPVARGLGKFLVGGSVGRVVGQIIRNNVNAPENRREKIRITVASYAISGMVANQAVHWFECEFDDLFAQIEKYKKSKNEIKNETTTEGTEWTSSPATSNSVPNDVQDPPQDPPSPRKLSESLPETLSDVKSL